MIDYTDAQIEAGLGQALRQIEATKALYEILLELKRKDTRTWHNYSADEQAELNALHRRHLLRRAKEEAVKCGINLGGQS